MPDQRPDEQLDQRPDERLDQRAVTPRRRAANQAAALRSTGPTSPEGKQRAAFNSFQHGAYAEQEKIRAQGAARLGSRSGRDPAELTNLRARLLNDWRPASAQQALLVGDLAWLYWLRDEAAQTLIDRQARQRLRDELEREERRFCERHRDDALERCDYHQFGCVNLKDSDQKFIAAARLLDQLDAWAARAEWLPREEDEEDADNEDDEEDDEDDYDEDDSAQKEAKAGPGAETDAERRFRVIHHQKPLTPEEIRVDLWGSRPNARGAQVRELWVACVLGRAQASDPRARRIRALIEEERAALAEEQALFARRRALDLDEPADETNGERGVYALGETWLAAVGAVERLDRQINAKVRLLIRLRTMDCSGDVSSPAVAGKTGGEDTGGADIALSAMSADTGSSSSHAPLENTAIAGTKPSKPLESTEAAVGDEAPEQAPGVRADA